MEILQGILCHLYLPLRHKDVLAREQLVTAASWPQSRTSPF